MLVDCGVALLVRHSSASSQPVKAPPVAAAKKAREKELDPDNSCQRVALLFGTQTDTAEHLGKYLLSLALTSLSPDAAGDALSSSLPDAASATYFCH